MFDGFKILNLPVSIQALLDNNLLSFPLPISENTGEVLNYSRIAKYKGLTIILKNENVKMEGSFHKFFNNGSHNYNDFYFKDFVNVIYKLENLFGIDLDIAILNNLEFGVNIHVKHNIDKIFESIINYKGIPFNPYNSSGAKGIVCELTNFYIKIYDKSHQYEVPGNILRIEIKVKKMRFFKDRGIKINTLSSLLDHCEILKICPVLLFVFNDILFTDCGINLNDLKPLERIILANGNNSKYWKNLRPDSKKYPLGNKDRNYKKDRKKYDRELTKFKNIVEKNATINIQHELSILIESKCNELMQKETQKRDKFTDRMNIGFKQVEDTEKYTKGANSHFSYSVNLSPVEKRNNLCFPCYGDVYPKKVKFMNESVSL
ncbi:MAG TPA: hypothetical protein DEP28_01840 [Bacteroidetes bacterium]|nr:hypothetical protein [Bacteroidota bacterium]